MSSQGGVRRWSARIGSLRARWKALVFGVLLALFTVSTFQGLGEYFLAGHEGFNGAQKSIIARNYVRYGLETGGRAVLKVKPPTSSKRFVIHWHHPPGLGLYTATAFALFGPSEAAARGAQGVMSVCSFIILGLLVRRRHGDVAALWALFFYTVLPMRVFFGNHVNYEITLITFAMAGLLALEHLRTETEPKIRKRWYGALALAIVALAMTDWPGYIYAGVLGFDALLRKPRQRNVFIVIGAISAVLLVVMLLWLESAARGEGLMGLAEYRSSSKVTFSDIVGTSIERASDYFGPIPLFVGMMWIAAEAAKKRVDPLVGTFTVWVFIYFMAFKQAARVHVFYLYFATPAIAVAAGVGIKELLALLTKRSAWAAGSMFVFALTASEWRRIELGHGRTYEILPPKKRAKGFPRDGRLNLVLVGKLVNEMSKPGDTILIDRHIEWDNQLSWYMDRYERRVRNFSDPGKSALFLTRERFASEARQKRLAREYSVTRTMGYLIYDLRSKKPSVRVLDYEKTGDGSLWWWYYESAFYPPHKLVSDFGKAKKYAKSLGLPSSVAHR